MNYSKHHFFDCKIQIGLDKRNHTSERFEDTKGVTGSRKLEDRQYSDQRKMDNKKKNDLQNITQQTKDWETQPKT